MRKKPNIELVFESNRSVTAEIDATKLSLAFSNLVENAIKYNRENGWVRVSLDADHKFFYVKVSDSGIGIPQESIDYILNVSIEWIIPLQRNRRNRSRSCHYQKCRSYAPGSHQSIQ